MTSFTHKPLFSKRTLLTTSALAVLALSACSSSGLPNGSYNNNVGAEKPTAASRAADKAIATALADATTDAERMSILSDMLIDNPANKQAALQYAALLRENEQYVQAQAVLTPFAFGNYKSAEGLTDMAMTNIALGDFKSAEMAALEATKISPKNAKAFLALGTAQDAQGMHSQAEDAFRQGIDNWQGDPAPILNNLALNLASQGKLDQSLEILEKARKISPERMEVERNYRIISTLKETAGSTPPPPNAKPIDNIIQKIEDAEAQNTTAKKAAQDAAQEAIMNAAKTLPAVPSSKPAR